MSQKFYWIGVGKLTKFCRPIDKYDVLENCPGFKTPHPRRPPTSKILPPLLPWSSNFK